MKKLILLLLFPISLFSQLVRVEMEVPSVSDGFTLIPAGRNGLLVCNESASSGRTQMWSFSSYDTLFRLVWKKEFPVIPDAKFLKSDITDSIASLLFAETTGSRAANPEMNGEYQIIQINISKGTFRDVSGKVDGLVEFSDFKSMSDMAMIGGRTVPSNTKVCLTTCYVYALACIPLLFGAMDFKQMPVIISANLTDKKKLLLPVMVPGSGNVTGIGKDTTYRQFNVIISNRPTRRTSRLFVRTISNGTAPPSDLEIRPGKVNELIKGKVSVISPTEKLLIGTFGNDISKQGLFEQIRRSFKKKSAEIKPDGFYGVRFRSGLQEEVHYYPFATLPSFISSQKKETRMFRNENLLLHDLIQSNGQYILIAESYYPEYHTEYQYTYVYGRPTTTPVDVFDGYRYTNAYILAFDETGKLLWDNSFEMWDILTMQLNERVKVLVRGKETALVYSYNGSIKSKIISGSKVIDGKAETPIETSRKGDEVKEEFKSNISHWYGNYFIAYGFQKIRNEKDTEKKRTVFYFNKISFQ